MFEREQTLRVDHALFQRLVPLRVLFKPWLHARIDHLLEGLGRAIIELRLDVPPRNCLAKTVPSDQGLHQLDVRLSNWCVVAVCVLMFAAYLALKVLFKQTNQASAHLPAPCDVCRCESV